MKLKNYNTKASSFFAMLPKEWQDAILPYWESVKSTTQLYVLVDKGEITVGGLVFHQCPPDMIFYQDKASYWFDNGFLYLGFIYVEPSRRQQNLGSKWIDLIKSLYPKQGFWLSIEDEKLDKFYTKNNFEKLETVKNALNEKETIYVYKP
jgi:GNAT superfamily N-acetyltransferase